MTVLRVGAAIAALILAAASGSAAERPRLYTNQTYIEDVTRVTELPLDDPKAMLAFVLESLPERVKVYPTENYYYFHFFHNGVRYDGNIRLDASDRDQGKVHFAYFEELSEWKDEGPVHYRLFDRSDGVLVERIADLVYRVSYADKSVVFELNDLSKLTPPPHALGPDEKYLGPVFDESGIRFFLVFNPKLKLFHYVLDETQAVADRLQRIRQTDRIVIGRRTGFAFYRDARLDRKILIGVYEGNAAVNNQFDGPFDQLPDNFVKGDELREAILTVDPELKGKIDRFGGSPDGSSRFLIGPYAHYYVEDDLLPFHQCATSRRVKPADYYRCFVIDDSQDGPPTPLPLAKSGAAAKQKAKKTAK